MFSALTDGETVVGGIETKEIMLAYVGAASALASLLALAIATGAI
ncbi:hypothetical protein [Halomontanus rarus]|nr:hypothetical protein [Halovivax sp. TS33]